MSENNETENNRHAADKLAVNPLLRAKPKIINVGLDGFADELSQQGVDVVRVAWVPPAGGDARLAQLLAKLGV